MAEIERVQIEVSIARRELKNIRKELMKLKAKLKEETGNIKLLLPGQNCKQENKVVRDQNEDGFNMVPIGFISSCFKNKNGIPRQPSLCQSAKATLEINKTYFTNPEHSLIGLSEFSYIWILFIFNKNTKSSVKAKVHPPRLNGKSVGVFSTRSPHRPCAIGLSLTKLDKIIGSTLFLCGIDMLDGTPVLDIKPYVPSYDTPNLHKNIGNATSDSFLSKNFKGSSIAENNSVESNCNIFMKPNFKQRVADDCNQDKDHEKSVKDENFQTDSHAMSIGTLLKMPSNQLEVVFTERANKDMKKFHQPDHDKKCEYCLDFITELPAAKQAIIDILQNDPRSVYRKNKCSDKLYFFEVDRLHITCWFDDMIAEVLRIKPINLCPASQL